MIVVLLLAGISLIVYPIWDDYRVKQQQIDILTQWDDAHASISKNKSTKPPMKVPPKLANVSNIPIEKSQKQQLIDEEQVIEEVEEEVPPSFEPIMLHGQQMIGKLTIDSIEVSQPILATATAAALDYGVGNVIEDRSPAQEGNFVLAGHRGRSYGRLLNRLHELERGDMITVETEDGTFEYEVNDSFLVTPDDLSVLDETEHLSELTLITCHPVRNPTHRLIVKAVLHQDDEDVAVVPSITK